MRYSEQEAKIRRDAMRDEEFELLFGEGTKGATTGIEPFFPWNKDANLRDNIAYYNKHIKADEFDNIPFPDKSGMITGAWDKAKEIGGEWWKNISKDPTANMNKYTNYWLDRLGHKGPPLKEDIVYKGVEKLWEDDYRKYWNERPLDYDWFNR
jgi:hypothetical protein